MVIEQIYTGCLSHAAYYIESDGEVAIFDPLRDTDSYIEKANGNDAVIKYIFETHFHADFVSGHLDLKKKTAADIVFGPTANPSYDAIIAKDGAIFKIGKCSIQLIHTPGHTMESSTYLIIDENGKQHGLITGDTLFIGDVGRPDLAQHVNKELTQEKLARLLFHSLREKIMPLEDHLIIYPNHGAGSACGKKMCKETTDTLGHQKITNYALRSDMSEDEFVSEVLSGLTNPPGYFPKNVLLNINGYQSLDSVLEESKRPLEVQEFLKLSLDEKVLILDTRDADIFAAGFVPNSLNIALNGGFAGWVGEMISDINQKILLVTDIGKEEESMIRLARVGYDNVVGYLEVGFESWKKLKLEIDSIQRLTAIEFHEEWDGSTFLIDVRKQSEFESEHVANALNVPLNQIYQSLDSFPKNQKFAIYCAGGYRSMIAASILKKNNFKNFYDVSGGFLEIKKCDIPISNFKPQVTML
ncbi:MAG: MBL fold metallo-hydrolase [Chryseobacterium sp.]|nr:MAG: MBL fold metallo-hydrolase [Chryseobacterium sp.]